MLRPFIIIWIALSWIACEKSAFSTIFIGSYTDNSIDTGLFVYHLYHKTGKLELVSQVDSLINPSFLKTSSDGRFLYAITESRLESPGFVSSYRLNENHLELINRVSTGGRNPVHIDISPDGKYLSVSNYSDPSLSFYTIDGEGRLSNNFQFFAFKDSSIIKDRQAEAHIHSSNFSIDGEFLFAHDLGGDKIRAFQVKDSLILREDLNVNISPGSGPRHFTFDREGKYGYLINELGGRIDVFDYFANEGLLTLVNSTLTYADTLDIYRSADIHITPNNQFLVVSNRGPAENTIVVYERLNGSELKLIDRKASGGDFPRNFAITPNGEYLIVANKESGNVVVFPFNQEIGRIGPPISEVIISQVSSIQILNRP
ncbi:lactonase family protein [Portibacter marinus]|uniref:lactonase family protein n=1 Tax=Portibacter marinus TaxID=2898660 RepID=UPI001F18A7F2|nr:lactonase family protein [Portibacter marinus]